MRARLDQNRRDVDHVRRLRNCFLHGNGLFDERYERDALLIKGKKDLLPDYQNWKKNPSQSIPILVDQRQFEGFYKAHIEILHQLHDTIQREEFGYKGPGYSYAAEKKVIDWSRVLRGL
jgi:hypothetical protein